MMKRLLTALLVLLPLCASAQGGIPVLDKVPDHRVMFHYTYSLSQDGQPMREVTRGDVLVEDNAYRMTGLGLSVTSDGTTRWSVDEAAEEVLVETVEKENLFTNPALFIGSYPNYLDRIQVHSQSADALDVTLRLDEGTSARFVLTGITFLDKEGKSAFTVDVKALPSSYIVTDLR